MSASRRWLEIAVRHPDSDEDSDDAPLTDALLADALIALGGRAVVEEDGWQVTHVPEPDDADGFSASLQARLEQETGLADVELRTRWLAEENWAETWKRGLAPRRISERLVVRPSWTDFVPGPEDLVIVLDPKMAFGTAEHGTTRGCLRLLDRAVERGDRVLDVGAGSGILAVAAALLGADEVVAVEGDSLAWEALLENIEFNGVAERVRLLRTWADGAAIAALGPFDGVVANIETGKLRPLLRGLADAVAPGGWFVISGVLAGEWDGVSREVDAMGLVAAGDDADGEWRSGWWRRPG